MAEEARGGTTFVGGISSSSQQRDIIEKVSKLQAKMDDLDRLNLKQSLDDFMKTLSTKMDKNDIDALESKS